MANDITSWSTTPNDNQTLDGLTWAEGTQTAASVNNSARQMMASTKAWYNDLSGAKAAGGTANAITLTSDVGFGTLANGLRVALIPTADNTGATTLNVNALGGKSVRVNGDFPCAGGEIRKDCPAEFIYNTALNSAAGGWLLTNPATNQRWGKGADVASASELVLGNDGNYFDITGTDAIESIASKGVGTIVKLHFDAGLTLTHHATDLVLPGGANITTAAGDEAEFVEYALGDWRCTNYQRAAAAPSFAWELISTASISSGSFWEVTDLSAFRELRITGWARPTSDADSFILRTSSNNGSSFDGGASDYSYQLLRATSTTVAGATVAHNGVPLNVSTTVGNNGQEAVQFTINVFEFNQAAYARFEISASYLDGSTAWTTIKGGAVRAAAAACNAIQIRAVAGTLAAGRITLEGIRG